jgi:hypothetical protein
MVANNRRSRCNSSIIIGMVAVKWYFAKIVDITKSKNELLIIPGVF